MSGLYIVEKEGGEIVSSQGQAFGAVVNAIVKEGIRGPVVVGSYEGETVEVNKLGNLEEGLCKEVRERIRAYGRCEFRAGKVVYMVSEVVKGGKV